MTNQEYTASDVKKLAGLSYRQINNWNSKGALPGGREGEEGWHKFSLKDIFAIMVCSEIQQQFNVQLESLKWILSFMQEERTTHLEEAYKSISDFGFNIWLLTDCKTTFIMQSDLEFESLFGMGFFRADEPRGYILLRINPIVNKILSCLTTPIELKTHDRVYRVIRQVKNEASSQCVEELEVLRLIRDGSYKHINVRLKNGRIICAEAEEEITDFDRDQILKVIEQNKYQTVTITKHDGKIVRLSRKIPFKLSGAKNFSSTHHRKNPEGEDE